MHYPGIPALGTEGQPRQQVDRNAAAPTLPQEVSKGAAKDDTTIQVTEHEDKLGKGMLKWDPDGSVCVSMHARPPDPHSPT